MKCWVMTSPIDSVKEYLIIPEDTPLTELPTKVQNNFRNGEILKTIEVQEGRKCNGFDPDRVLRNINRKGYILTK